MAIEIVDLPMKLVIFHSYVKFPEDGYTLYIYIYINCTCIVYMSSGGVVVCMCVLSMRCGIMDKN